MILNYVLKYITKISDIPLCFMKYVCKNVHKLVYTVSNLHINVLLLGQHVEKNHCHNGNNNWPDFPNDISYFISKLI